MHRTNVYSFGQCIPDCQFMSIPRASGGGIFVGELNVLKSIVIIILSRIRSEESVEYKLIVSPLNGAESTVFKHDGFSAAPFMRRPASTLIP